MVVFGTRPEAIKLAPLVQAFEASPIFEPIVVVTGQHREMLDQVLNLFGIVPRHDLNILRARQTLTDVTVRALRGISEVVEQEMPDAVVVQGDTTTTLSGGLAGFYHQIPVVHVEAGLRTSDRYSPYPEEINRRLTTQLTTLHLAPTQQAKMNLLDENVPAADVVVTGNTVIDALRASVEIDRPYGIASLETLETDQRRVLLVTAHRRESWADGLASIAVALARLAEAEPDLLIVFPIHRNPVVRDAISPTVEGHENIRLVEPLEYGPFTRLMRRATVVLTDSGGIQEEAPSLGKPVLVMRDTTERPEAILAGTARLVGTNADAIFAGVRELLRDEDAYRAMATAVNPYGDGQAVRRSLQAIAHLFDLGPRSDEFAPVGGESRSV